MQKSLSRSSRTQRADDDPYFIAIKAGDIAAIQKHLAAGRTVDELNEDGKSPLRYAAEFGQTETMVFLCSQGATVTYTDFDGSGNRERLPIHDAAKSGHAAAIAFLMNEKSPINVKDGTGLTPLHLIAGFPYHQDLEQETESRYLAAFIALCSGTEPLNLDDTDVRADSEVLGRTALHRAILNRHEGIALSLIQRGAKTNTLDNKSCSPYLSAYRLGLRAITAAIVNRLVEQGGQEANQYLVDGEANTILHLAAEEGDVAFIEQLCTAGANPNPLNKDQKTPLFIAAREGRTDAVKCLLKQGGNPTLKPRFSDKGPLEIARKKGHTECVTLLEEWFANPANKKLIAEEESDDSSVSGKEGDSDEQPIGTGTPIEEPLIQDNLSLLCASLLDEEFLIINEIKALLQALVCEEKPQQELQEYLKLLEYTTDLPNLEILSTALGKNLIHIIAEHDPKGTLLPTLKKLSASRLKALLHYQAKGGIRPFHAACAEKHRDLIVFCVEKEVLECSIEPITEFIGRYQELFIGAILRKNQGISLLRRSLEHNGTVIDWLLSLKHLPRKMDFLFDLMRDHFANLNNTAPSRSPTPSRSHFFVSAPQQSAELLVDDQSSFDVRAHLRNQLLFRVFHRHKWPDELIEALAILIGSPPASFDKDSKMNSEQKLLTFIKSNGASSAKQHRLVNHVVVMLALSYQYLEKKESKSISPCETLERQYLDLFLKRPEEMLRRVAELYDYLSQISPGHAQLFLAKIANSQSILKKAIHLALQKQPYNEPWWHIDVKDAFIEILQRIFTQIMENHYAAHKK